MDEQRTPVSNSNEGHSSRIPADPRLHALRGWQTIFAALDEDAFPDDFLADRAQNEQELPSIRAFSDLLA